MSAARSIDSFLTALRSSARGAAAGRQRAAAVAHRAACARLRAALGYDARCIAAAASRRPTHGRRRRGRRYSFWLSAAGAHAAPLLGYAMHMHIYIHTTYTHTHISSALYVQKYTCGYACTICTYVECTVLPQRPPVVLLVRGCTLRGLRITAAASCGSKHRRQRQRRRHSCFWSTAAGVAAALALLVRHASCIRSMHLPRISKQACGPFPWCWSA